VSLEGGDRKLFDAVVHALGWTANPALQSGGERSGVAGWIFPPQFLPSGVQVLDIHP